MAEVSVLNSRTYPPSAYSCLSVCRRDVTKQTLVLVVH